MTDRIKGVVVTFAHDIREDDAEMMLDAIRMVKGVQDVSVVKADPSDHIVRCRVFHEIADAVYETFNKVRP